MMIKSEKSIKNDQWVSAYRYGDSVEMSTALGGKPVMRKISKDEMVHTVTGEIKEINHVTNRADPRNFASLRATFRKLRRLIGANFFGGESELWLTLTYRDSPMTDSKRLYADFKRFIRRLRRITKKELAYIVVIEPQGSGSLHAHLLLKTLDHSHLYIANNTVAKAWGQGFVNVKRLSSSDNVSAYLMSYLTNIDLNNLDGDFSKKSTPKKIVKGQRLGLYPLDMQIYRTSRKGIVKSTKMFATKQDIKNKYDLGESDYYKSFDVKKGNNDDIFSIEVEYYSISKAKIKKMIDKINKKQ